MVGAAAEGGMFVLGRASYGAGTVAGGVSPQDGRGMAGYVIDMLRALRAYLWASFFERVGPLWWGVSLAAVVVAYALCSAGVCRAGEDLFCDTRN